MAAILIGWQLLSLFVDPVYIASPASTVRALAGLAWGSTLWVAARSSRSSGWSSAWRWERPRAWVLGVAAGSGPRVRAFLEPVRWVGMTIPVVIVAGLALLWFGLGDFTVMFVVALIVLPTMYVNTVEGVLTIDRRLVEMGRVYRFPRGLLCGEVYLPGVASPSIAGLTLATGIAVRAVVLAEVLAAANGIGHAFARASSLPRVGGRLRLGAGAARADGGHRVRRAAAGRRRAMRWRKAAE